MKLLPSKRILSTVLLSCTLLFTVNASAEDASLERSLAATVQVQGKKAIRDLSSELAKSIKAELNGFSMRHTIVSVQDLAAAPKQTKLRQSKQQTSEE